MASPHTTTQPPFLVFPTLSSEYLWRVIAVETGRTISRHRNLALAYKKAEELNLRSSSASPAMPDRVFAQGEDFLASDLRGTCQSWYDNGASDPANGYECNRPASITDLETACSFCVRCYRESVL